MSYLSSSLLTSSFHSPLGCFVAFLGCRLSGLRLGSHILCEFGLIPCHSLCLPRRTPCSSTSTIFFDELFQSAGGVHPNHPIISPYITNTFNMISTLVPMDIYAVYDFLVSRSTRNPVHIFNLTYSILTGINPLVSSHALLSSVHDPPLPIHHVTPIFISPPPPLPTPTVHNSRRARSVPFPSST